MRNDEAGVPDATPTLKTVQKTPHFVAVGCSRDQVKRNSVVKSVTYRDVERVRGIEPLYEAWEAAVLPLNYTRRRRRF